MTLDAALGTLAELQQGLVHRRQARLLGATRTFIRHRVDSGRWQERHEGVFAILGAPPTHRQAIVAAVLAAGPVAAASHSTAAAVHGLPRLGSGRIEVIVRRPRHPRIAGVRVHAVSRFDEERDVVKIDGIRVTTVSRTIVDLAARGRALRLSLALDHALTHGLTTLDDVAGDVDRLTGKGVHGSTLVKALLAERDPAQSPPASVLESNLAVLIRAAGLPEPVRHHPVEHEGRVVAEIDTAWPELQLGIEGDGWGAHGGREAFESDRERANLLTAIGWRLVRVTWRQLVRQPEATASVVRAAFATARRAHRQPAPEVAA